MSSLPADPPRTPRVDPARRESIIRTAHAAFLADGYAATSMSSLAARLGGSKGTLYNYFTSKEALFIAVVESKCEEKLAFIYDGELDGRPFRDGLAAIGTRFLGFVLSEESIATYRLVTAEAGRFPELGRALYENGFKVGVGKLAAHLDGAVAAGDMKPCDTRIAAEQFFELCKSGIHHQRLWNVTPPPSPDEIAAHISRTLDVFLKAYAANA